MNLISGFQNLWLSTGLGSITVGQTAMIAVSLLLIYLAIKKGFEPLLLLPIGFGGLLANIPVAGIAAPEAFLELIEGHFDALARGEMMQTAS